MSLYQGIFRPAWWANNAHVQTILPVILPFDMPSYTRERWDTPDDDFIDLDWVNLESAANAGKNIHLISRLGRFKQKALPKH